MTPQERLEAVYASSPATFMELYLLRQALKQLTDWSKSFVDINPGKINKGAGTNIYDFTRDFKTDNDAALTIMESILSS